MRIRRVVLDVDKAFAQPSLSDIAVAIDRVRGVEGFNISVEEVDQETVGTLINVEGDNIDLEGLLQAIEHAGAAVHGIEELVVGAAIPLSVAVLFPRLIYLPLLAANMTLMGVGLTLGLWVQGARWKWALGLMGIGDILALLGYKVGLS